MQRILMMTEMTYAYGAGTLLGIAAGAVALLLVLIMRFRVHAFLALTLVSIVVALITKVPFDKIVPTILSGFGSTLAGVALLVGLGAMIGRLLEVSGGAKVLADTLINKFGSHRAPFALGVASLLFGFPIFFDAGLVVMLPIIFSVAKQFGGSTLKYALPAAGRFRGDACAGSAASGPGCRERTARREYWPAGTAGSDYRHPYLVSGRLSVRPLCG